MKKLIIVYIIVIISITSCDLLTQVDSPASITSQSFSTENSGEALALPLNVTITIQDDNPVVMEPFAVTLAFETLTAVDALRGQLESSGSLNIAGIPELSWSGLEANERRSVDGTFTLTEVGESTVRWQVEAYDSQGQFLYSQGIILHFLATEDGVFMSMAGGLELQLEYLAQLLERGEISQAEYDARLDEILGGGAETDIQTESN